MYLTSHPGVKVLESGLAQNFFFLNVASEYCPSIALPLLVIFLFCNFLTSRFFGISHLLGRGRRRLKPTFLKHSEINVYMYMHSPCHTIPESHDTQLLQIQKSGLWSDQSLTVWRSLDVDPLSAYASVCEKTTHLLCKDLLTRTSNILYNFIHYRQFTKEIQTKI